ncbi:MAG: DNA repair protein RadC [Thermodesulfobacteriota bacterium]|nr:DNA repair protein RadC [Thermodesulfobacteriota bacterium]
MEKKDINKTITSWPLEDRPREKLEKFGADKMTDADLIAILIRTGTKEKTAVDLGRQIISEVGGIAKLGRMTIPALQKIKGIGLAKAVTITSAFQLGLRFSKQDINLNLPKISAPSDVAKIYGAELSLLNNEIFKVLLLKGNNRIFKDVIVSTGNINNSTVHPREIFKIAIDNLAVGIILMHNHPSGNKKPSKQDIGVTKRIVEAGKIIGIPVLDHLIIAGNDYFSFADEGLIEM